MKKQYERTALTRSTIINTFLELSRYKSADKITVSEISHKAGYNRSTFYQYFDDTHHLISCIEDDLMNYIKDTIVSRICKANPEQFFIDVFIKVYEEKRDILKLLFRGTDNSFPAKLKEFLIPLFAQQLQMPQNEEQTVYKLDFYLSGIIAVISRWVSSETAMSPKEYALLMQQIVEGMRKSQLFNGL